MGNEIGDAGAQSIVQALEINQVRYTVNFPTSISILLYLLQTLTTLDLEYNELGEGSKELLRKLLEKTRNLKIWW